MDYFKEQLIKESARGLNSQCNQIIPKLGSMLSYLDNEQLFSEQFGIRVSNVTSLIQGLIERYTDIRDTISNNPHFLEKFMEQELKQIDISIALSIKPIEIVLSNLFTLFYNKGDLECELKNIVELEKLFFYDEHGYFVSISSFYSKLIAKEE